MLKLNLKYKFKWILNIKLVSKIKWFFDIHNLLSSKKINNYKNKYKKTYKEYKILVFFWFLLLLLLFRLFRLQIVQAWYYEKVLFSQHFTKSLLKAKRWNIYVSDKSNKTKSLTENIELYNMYVDPKFVKNKPKLIEILTPIFYEHFCVLNWLNKPTKEECIQNIEKFTNSKILPDQDTLLTLSWEEKKIIITPEYLSIQKQKIIEEFSWSKANELISKQLDQIIKTWIREKNYLWFYDNDKLLQELKKKNFSFLEINWNYIYTIPSKVENIDKTTQQLQDIFIENSQNISYQDIKLNLLPKEIRYIDLLKDINWKIAKEIKDLKKDHFDDKTDWIPLLHGIWLEKIERRFYPYWSFMSHIIWFVDKDLKAYYWVEQYFDEFLNWQDWELVWLSVPWIWAIWSNTFEIKKPIDWNDIYLTIDPVIQKEIESIWKFYYNQFSPDTLWILIMDPFNWKIKATFTYPDFDPNNYEENYKIKPLEYEDRQIIDDDSYIDMPILIVENDKLRVATYDERKNPDIKKYIFKNKIWPTIFKDKNISTPIEPWSVFKAITLGIWMDSDELSMYDLYEDKGEIEVWPFTISNVHKECKWTHTFLNALERSCNVWMSKIAQKVWKFVFYNYLENLEFWKLTNIELAWEEEWSIEANNDYSLARFYNNSFWQWLLVTPIQMIQAYAALVNWWYLVKPTIIDKMYDRKTNSYIQLDKKVYRRIFKPQTSEKIKEALFQVINEWDLKWLSITWFTLWWKTWTSQIAFKWTYRWWWWWTNWAFIWILTKDDLKYLVVINLRRPRASQWWVNTAWKMFKDISKLLIENEWIKK